MLLQSLHLLALAVMLWKSNTFSCLGRGRKGEHERCFASLILPVGHGGSTATGQRERGLGIVWRLSRARREPGKDKQAGAACASTSTQLLCSCSFSIVSIVKCETGLRADTAYLIMASKSLGGSAVGKRNQQLENYYQPVSVSKMKDSLFLWLIL